MNTIDEIIEHTAINGGASINLASGSTPTGGYMVSRAGSEIITEMPKLRGDLERFVQAYQEELDNSDTYLGTWIDPDTGLVYLDISDNLDNLDTAVALGVERAQLAIYAVEQNAVPSGQWSRGSIDAYREAVRPGAGVSDSWLHSRGSFITKSTVFILDLR